MNYKQIQRLSSQDFKRFTGIQKSTFEMMLKAWEQDDVVNSNAGRPPKLKRAEQLLIALQYWREDRTYFHIAQNWSISESTVCRIVKRVEKALMESGRLRIPRKKHLIKGYQTPKEVLIDVTETPIERPQKAQKRYYSGKKKEHTLKCQVLAEQDSGKIICLFFGKGSEQDFRIFKASGVKIPLNTETIQDSGYQGIHTYHANSYIPKKNLKMVS